MPARSSARTELPGSVGARFAILRCARTSMRAYVLSARGPCRRRYVIVTPRQPAPELGAGYVAPGFSTEGGGARATRNDGAPDQADPPPRLQRPAAVDALDMSTPAGSASPRPSPARATVSPRPGRTCSGATDLALSRARAQSAPPAAIIDEYPLTSRHRAMAH